VVSGLQYLDSPRVNGGKEMRKAAIYFLVLATVPAISRQVFAQTTNSAFFYTFSDLGGATLQTADTGSVVIAGYSKVDPTAGVTPSGVAIFGLRQNGVLISEAGVPGMTAMLSGRMYAEVNGVQNTGVAFANPSSSSVVISFFTTDQTGTANQNSFTLGANTQIATFLNQAPFNVKSGFTGTLTFTASAPVGVIGLRTFVNERGDFLMTTENVTSLPDGSSASLVLMAHFADGGGWQTQVILVNTTDSAISGVVQFYNDGSGNVAATPITMTVNGQTSASFNYTISARSSFKLQTSGTVAAALQTGSIRITPITGVAPPSAFAVFSFSSNGVTVTQATIQTVQSGTAFRGYVEVNSAGGAPGSIDNGIAIANTSSVPATVNFDLTDLKGVSTGLTASVVLPPLGHVARLLHDLFPTLGSSFQGVVRISSSTLISAVDLRIRYNERGDVLVTTTPASNEASGSTTAELLFPQIVDGAGFSTQLVLFSGVAGQTSNGTIQFIGQSGQALTLTVQ
jgi:hypothetical protein